MREAREKRKFPLIVVDPRVTMLAQNADLHLPVKPGTDVVLLNSIAHVILQEGLQDQAYIEAHNQEFAAFRNWSINTTRLLPRRSVVSMKAAFGMWPACMPMQRRP